MINFNVPPVVGSEMKYIEDVINNKQKISGDGEYTKKCHKWIEERFKTQKALLTTSCTHALEMAAILCNIQPGDEVIAPSFTFVSSALAFVRAGATIVFADSCKNNPNIDSEQIEALLTS